MLLSTAPFAPAESAAPIPLAVLKVVMMRTLQSGSSETSAVVVSALVLYAGITSGYCLCAASRRADYLDGLRRAEQRRKTHAHYRVVIDYEDACLFHRFSSS